MTKYRYILLLLILISFMFALMVLEFIYLNDFASALQNIFPYWRNRLTTLVLSDMLFLQGGVLIFLGALISGVILYNSWGTTPPSYQKIHIIYLEPKGNGRRKKITKRVCDRVNFYWSWNSLHNGWNTYNNLKGIELFTTSSGDISYKTSLQFFLRTRLCC